MLHEARCGMSPRNTPPSDTMTCSVAMSVCSLVDVLPIVLSAGQTGCTYLDLSRACYVVQVSQAPFAFPPAQCIPVCNCTCL